MKGQFPPIPEPCLKALAEIEQDPLDLTPETEAHVAACLSCSETRIAWLAQAPAEAQAPAGYFERLPERILGKLPSGPRRRPHLALWALAAALLLAVATGGFWAGRANRAPVAEATLAPAPQEEVPETLPEIPFQGEEEDYAQLPHLSPEQAKRVIEQVSNQAPNP